MKITMQEKKQITMNVQASLSLEWIISLTKKLEEIEHYQTLLNMKRYYDERALQILRESDSNEITVYPKYDTVVTLTIENKKIPHGTIQTSMSS